MANKPPKAKYKAKFTSFLDPNKHNEKLKEIEDNIAADAAAAALLAEEMEEMLDEEEMGSEEFEYEDSLSEGEPALNVGRIDLSFPETIEEYKNSPQCFSPSYYSLSPKERLLLLYAENFRKQFVLSNPKRRAMVLALPNECQVQKFVCCTIRPTAFLHIPLIRSLEGIASFVADFIVYEPLEDLMNFPTRLVSPDTLLRVRRGNSFEMATLLCSMLIGAGFPALVVSGVARAEVVLNDQRKEPYPYPIQEIETEEKPKPVEQPGQKYKLRPLPDLESHLEEQMAEVHRLKEEGERRQREEIIRQQLEELEIIAVDRYHYCRSHAWVVIIDNAPWSIQPKITFFNENGDSIEAPPAARFIEPSTGFICETHCKQYILIDSVWNQYNYYINKQKHQRISELRWDLRNLDDWEHLLPGEPPEMRAYKVVSDEHIQTDSDHTVQEEKHLDTIRTWVSRLHIGLKDFEQRFPNLEKTVHYKGAIHERYSPYSQRDGKVMQLTLFEDEVYNRPKERLEYYENRFDRLLQLKYMYEDEQHEETFAKGRNDSLKFMRYCPDTSKPRQLYFYSAPRLDCLSLMEVHLDRIILHYNNRSDRCWYREFEFKHTGSVLRKVTEKFLRNIEDNVPANKDIATRTFVLQLNKILLKFHYSHGALTASTREFIKPQKPDYGQELIFDPTLTKGYKANPTEPSPTQLELYKLLLEQLDHEERAKKQFERIQEDVNTILDLRRQEKREPKLRFRIFDPLRNAAARALRMKIHAKEKLYKEEMVKKPADFLAPYLVPYKNRNLTPDESLAAYNACLGDLKMRFVSLLNDLQRQYEDLTTESKSLKRFLNKFENQFDNYDYERLVKEAKDIELNKRMVQQRLTLTHEESQKKYEQVKESLSKDPRLNLTPI